MGFFYESSKEEEANKAFRQLKEVSGSQARVT